MELSVQERRALMVLWCKVAWADGKITETERKRVQQLLQRLGDSAVGIEELEAWLTLGPPDIDLRLPEAARELFLREAVSIVSVDLDVAPVEIGLVRHLLESHFQDTHDMTSG